jgi:hypothetical protein
MTSKTAELFRRFWYLVAIIIAAAGWLILKEFF